MIFNFFLGDENHKSYSLNSCGRFQSIGDCDIVQCDFDLVNEMIQRFHMFSKTHAEQTQLTCRILPEFEDDRLRAPLRPESTCGREARAQPVEFHPPAWL